MEPTKFNKAVDRATNKTDEAHAPIGDAKAMISTFEPGEMEAIAKTGKVEFAPQMMSLEPGQKIEGILEGKGPGNDFVNEQTGEVRHVDSWIIRSPDGAMRVSILSSAQLDRKLPPFKGGPIGIARNKDLKAGNGFKVADYHVWGPKLPNGAMRVFHQIEASADDKVLPVGTAEVPALPAGQPNGVGAAAAQAPAAS